MTFVASLVIALVVWSISLIRSIRLRAFVYSLPIPITVVLLSGHTHLTGAQLIGVVALNMFFLVVTWLHHYLRWHVLWADLAGAATYVAIGSALGLISAVPFAPVLAAVIGIWIVFAVVSAFIRKGTDGSRTHAQEDGDPFSKLVKFAVALIGAYSMVWLGELLKGLVVTFPYSGVLVAIETRRDLPSFTRHFAINSIALVAFVAGYYSLQDRSHIQALAVGWLSFGVTAMVIQMARRFRAGIRPVPEGPREAAARQGSSSPAPETGQ